MLKNKVAIEGKEYELTPIGDMDITDKWVVVEPLTFREPHQKLDVLVVKAWGGFGCKGAALSLSGGKTFVEDSKGGKDTYYRSEFAGLATKEMLDSLGVE